MKKLLLLILIIVASTGCRQFDRIGNAIYDPVTTTNIVATPSGNYPVVSTNGWVLKPSITGGIEIAGDVAPFPWSGLASNALIAALGIGAAIRGKQWKKAAVSGVSAAQAFKRELRSTNKEKADAVKRSVVAEQRASGTQTLIQTVLSKL